MAPPLCATDNTHAIRHKNSQTTSFVLLTTNHQAIRHTNIGHEGAQTVREAGGATEAENTWRMCSPCPPDLCCVWNHQAFLSLRQLFPRALPGAVCCCPSLHPIAHTTQHAYNDQERSKQLVLYLRTLPDKLNRTAGTTASPGLPKRAQLLYLHHRHCCLLLHCRQLHPLPGLLPWPIAPALLFWLQ